MKAMAMDAAAMHADMDARTLIEAEAIQGDSKRLAAATKKIGEQVADAAKAHKNAKAAKARYVSYAKKG